MKSSLLVPVGTDAVDAEGRVLGRVALVQQLIDQPGAGEGLTVEVVRRMPNRVLLGDGAFGCLLSSGSGRRLLCGDPLGFLVGRDLLGGGSSRLGAPGLARRRLSLLAWLRARSD